MCSTFPCFGAALVLLVLLGGCVVTEEPTCLDRFPATGDAAVDFPDEDPEGVAADCAAEGGSDCDPALFLPMTAVECLAVEEGLAEGIEAWRYGLVFHHDHLTVVWNVENTTHSAPGKSGGEYLTFHATSGVLLQEGGWEAMD